MSRTVLSNEEYLTSYIADSEAVPKFVLLPHEVSVVDAELAGQDRAFDDLIEDKVSVSGGDDWHDGAFRATDNDANVISQQKRAIARFLNAVVVEYPLPADQRVSLGSRVLVEQQGFAFPVDIVGFRVGYPEGIIDGETKEEVVGVSPDAPLARSIIGKTAGETSSFQNEGRTIDLIIKSVSQTALSECFKGVIEER